MLEYCPEARPSTHDILEAWDFKEQEETIEKGVLEPITDIEPLRAEIVEEDSTTLVVFTNRGLLSWRFGGGQTEILGKFDSILNGNLCTFSAVAVGETLYVLRWDKAVFKLNPFEENSTWTRVADTKLGHGANPAAVAFEDSMVVCGGGWEQGGWHRLRNWPKLKTSSKCELYRPDTDQWEDFPSLNEKRRLNTVIESDGYIYCIGGIGESPITSLLTWNWQSEKALKSVEKYDPDKNVWVCVAPMTQPRCSPAAAEHDGLLYVLGGGGGGDGTFNYLGSVECYHPKRNVWTMLTQSLIQPRIKFRAVIQDRKLYAVGGERTQSIEMLDLDAEEDDREWKMVYQLDGFQLESMGTVVMQPY